MWLRLDLQGIIVSLQIHNYRKVPKDDCGTWCKVDYSFVTKSWLSYGNNNDEILLCSEIDEIITFLEKLVTDQLQEPTEFGCVEPDFRFRFYPKKDLRNDPKYTHVAPGYEIVDISMEWEVTLWNNGYTANRLVVTLKRQKIMQLLSYLRLIAGKVSPDDPVILQLMESRMIDEDIT